MLFLCLLQISSPNVIPEFLFLGFFINGVYFWVYLLIGFHFWVSLLMGSFLPQNEERGFFKFLSFSLFDLNFFIFFYFLGNRPSDLPATHHPVLQDEHPRGKFLIRVL